MSRGGPSSARAGACCRPSGSSLASTADPSPAGNWELAWLRTAGIVMPRQGGPAGETSPAVDAWTMRGAATGALRSALVEAPSLRSASSSREELLSLADLTLAAYLRYLASYGGAIHEEDGVLLFAGPHRQP